MGAKVSNCGHDENNRYSNGKAGDQTKTEYRIANWYNYPWDVTLRPIDDKVAEEIAKVAKAAANNDCIGYDQSYNRDSGKTVGGRMSFYEQLKLANWKPSKIKTDCETDCSASTIAVIIAVGYRASIKVFQKLAPSLTTYGIEDALMKTRLFERVKVTDERYAKAGDINLNTKHHVNITVESGALAPSSKKKKLPTIPDGKKILKKGSTGTKVGNLQECLNYLGFTDKDGKELVVDLDFGSKTEYALTSFQNKYMKPKEVDGEYGPLTQAMMEKVLK